MGITASYGLLLSLTRTGRTPQAPSAPQVSAAPPASVADRDLTGSMLHRAGPIRLDVPSFRCGGSALSAVLALGREQGDGGDLFFGQVLPPDADGRPGPVPGPAVDHPVGRDDQVHRYIVAR